MNKISVNVPLEIKYISDWDNFDYRMLQGHSIINKTVTGCGFTEFCLCNSLPTILCSPRKFLLENKYGQHVISDGPNNHLYLVVNKGEKSLDIDKDISKEDLTKSDIDSSPLTDDLTIISGIKDSLIDYLFKAQMECFSPKILVTYDSLKYVLDVLGQSIQDFSVVVDEFQNIFIDSRFKSDTELNFISYLQGCPNVTYVSATPMLEEYLEQMDEFKNLPYYEFIWDPGVIRKPYIQRIKCKSVQTNAINVINKYLAADYPYKILPDGTIIKSTELVLYVNSVSMITRIIKKAGLREDQVNIICAKTGDNEKKLRKIKMGIGEAPRRGKPHKMFTFCTRTVYAGADFYSPCASTVILSDCNLKTMAVDISLDLPQIMGRQRLDSNLFRDEAVLFYKTLDSEDAITKENFERMVQDKIGKTESKLRTYNNAFDYDKNDYVTDLRSLIKMYNYSDSYTGIDEKTGQPKVNKLVILAERRAFEIKNSTYIDDISLYNEMSSNGFQVNSGYNDIFLEFMGQFRGLTTFVDRMKLVCQFIEIYGDYIDIMNVIELSEYTKFINLLGTDGVRAKGYEKYRLENEVQIADSGKNLSKEITNKFLCGRKYTLKDVKKELQLIYDSLNLTKTAKASDIEEYYEVKKIKLWDANEKKQNKGYELLELK
jgi:hypothetical protein